MQVAPEDCGESLDVMRLEGDTDLTPWECVQGSRSSMKREPRALNRFRSSQARHECTEQNDRRGFQRHKKTSPKAGFFVP